MRIRSIEKADREFFIDRCHAFYRTPACDHEIPQQNAERTFELLMHGTPSLTDELAPERKSSSAADRFEQRERNALLRDAEQMEQRCQPR